MPTLAYWDIRGLAQPIRLLLHLVGEEFEEKLFACGPAPDFNKDCWYSIKESLPFDFPNLPYYIDGDVHITQTNAILRYIARKHNMCGVTNIDQAQVDVMLDQAMDFRNEWVRFCYNPKNDELKPGYVASLPGRLKAFEKCLGENKWFVSDQVTVADIHIYELLDQHLVWDPDCLKDFPKLRAFLARFEALPAIKKYMSSPSFIKSPINNKMAAFIG